jgi:hypothetical protein
MGEFGKEVLDVIMPRAVFDSENEPETVRGLTCKPSLFGHTRGTMVEDHLDRFLTASRSRPQVTAP